MTFHTKAATDDIYELFNQPAQKIKEESERSESESEDEDEDDEIIYTEHETELVVGSADEVLDAGFTYDEDSPEGIFDDVFGSESVESDEE